MKMKLKTKNFGTIETDGLKKIIFEKGIPGFRDLHEYIMIEDEDESSVFAYLQSAEDGEVSFIITSPYCFVNDYTAEIKEEYIMQLGGGSMEDYSVFVIATVVSDFERATLNLVAPIIIQNKTRKGMQVILENTSYTTRHKMIELLENRRG